MAIDCTSVAKHLKVMRAITGLEEEPGSGDNPKIMGMRDWIACTYPEMMDYCLGYTGDDVAWCGLATAFCCTVAGIRPPFGPTDTDRFLWAQSFGGDGGFEHLLEPVLGAIVVMTRSGGGHVTMFEGWVDEGVTFRGRGGNQSDEVNVSTYPVEDVIAWVWPRGVPMPAPGPSPEPPEPDEHPTLEEGDSGQAVEHVQLSLGIPADGEFGGQTDAAVKGFQDAVGLTSDGVVGPMTWQEIEALDAKMAEGDDGLEEPLQQEIIRVAKNSAIYRYSWEDRGKPPPGYIPGMALAFALAVRGLQYGDGAVQEMAQADTRDEDVDALAWYDSELTAMGWDVSNDGVNTLRYLFAMMMGLGMRESSGSHWEGRDMSASNVEPDTCEAGLFQSSWNLSTASDEIPILFSRSWNDPNGFRPVFSEGLSPSEADLDNYGNGAQGTRYQWLAKYCPAFAVYMTGVGLRTRRQHWGPINRKEVELVQEADELLQDVQDLVETAGPSAVA